MPLSKDEIRSLLSDIENVRVERKISSQLNIPGRTLFRIIDTLKSDERIRRVGSEKSGTWEVIE